MKGHVPKKRYTELIIMRNKLRYLIFTLAVLSVFTFSAFATNTSQTATKPTTTKPASTDSSTTATTKPQTSGNWTYTVLSNGTVEITKYKGNEVNCTVPSKLGGKTVSSIASEVFKQCSALKTLTIPSSVRSIKQNFIYACFTLETIKINNGSVSAFELTDCPALKTVYLPDTLTNLSRFENCPQLENIHINSKNKIFKSTDGVVYTYPDKNGKSSLIKYPQGKTATRFVVPSNVLYIQDNAFLSVEGNVKEIFIPSTVKSISALAFEKCYADLLCEPKTAPTGWAAALAGKNVLFGSTNLKSPSKVISDQNSSAIKLAWSKSEGATGYRVFYRSGGKWKAYATTKNTSITISNLKAGARFTFAIRAYSVTNKVATWAYNYTVYEAATIPPAPTKTIAKQDTSRILLSWTKVKNTDGYRVFYKSGNKWKVYKNTTDTKILITGLKTGGKYTFTIRPYIKTQDKVIWGKYKAFSTCTMTAAPTITAKVTAGESIKITWNKITGAERYAVFYSANGGKWTSLSVVKGNEPVTITLLTKGLPVGTKISFAVRGAISTDSGYVLGQYKPVTVTVK